MRATLLQKIHDIRSSYWFVPSVMAASAIGAAMGVGQIDARVDTRAIVDWAWLHANHPDGARAVLGTIAGSMITVAGVTFSITIAAVANTASQVGPRLLANFLRDTGNQITLGTFIATFLYCVMLMRTVVDSGGASQAFVPHIGVFVALVLAVLSVGVLIYFIHHLPASIHVPNMIAGIGVEVRERIDADFPDRLDVAARDGDAADVPDLPRDSFASRAPRDGYVQQLDYDGLMSRAATCDVVVHLCHRPGDFVHEGAVLARFAPAGDDADETATSVTECFALGRQRTGAQDLLYSIDQLIEVAIRALSPGVNDPYTATGCIDWLGAAIVRLGGRKLRPATQADDDGTVRIVMRPLTFEGFVAATFGRLRPHVARDRLTTLHALRTIADTIGSLPCDADRACVLAEAERLRDAAAERLASDAHDALDEQLERARTSA